VPNLPRYLVRVLRTIDDRTAIRFRLGNFEKSSPQGFVEGRAHSLVAILATLSCGGSPCPVSGTCKADIDRQIENECE